VALDPNLGYHVFEYEPAFVRTGIELAPLTMPLAQAREPFVFTDLPDKTYKRLPALLADQNTSSQFGRTVAGFKFIRVGICFNRCAKGLGGTKRGILDVVSPEVGGLRAAGALSHPGQTVPGHAQRICALSILRIQDTTVNTVFKNALSNLVPNNSGH
jgi:hypothetical protein